MEQLLQRIADAADRLGWRTEIDTATEGETYFDFTHKTETLIEGEPLVFCARMEGADTDTLIADMYDHERRRSPDTEAARWWLDGGCSCGRRLATVLADFDRADWLMTQFYTRLAMALREDGTIFINLNTTTLWNKLTESN